MSWLRVGPRHPSRGTLAGDRRPQTRYRLTAAGRRALLRHVAELQELVGGGQEAGAG